MTTPRQLPAPGLKSLVLLQVLVGAGLSIGGWLMGSLQLGASIAVGSALMVISVGLMGWSSHRLIAKKSIAWTTMIIVIKYAVLLGSIVYLARTGWFSSLGAGFGIASFMIAALIFAGLNFKKETN